MRYSAAGFCALFMLGTAVQAHGDDFPSRRAGLWEMTVKEEGQPQGHTMKQCTDTATDKKMMQMGSELGANGQKSCVKNEFRKTSTGYESYAECTFSGSTMIAKGAYTGDFATSYSGEIKTTFKPAFFGRESSRTVISAKYLGACSGDMKPGDMVMNGMKMNVDAVAAQAKQAAAMMNDPKVAAAMQNAAKMMAQGKGGQGGLSQAQLQAMQQAMQGMNAE